MKITTELLAEMKTRANANETLPAIAAATGVSLGTVKYWRARDFDPALIRDRGLDIRPQIVAMRKGGARIADIAHVFGLRWGAIQYQLRRDAEEAEGS